MLPSFIRISQRYLVPRIVSSIYYFFRYRCMVSSLAKVQLTRNISFGKGTMVKPFSVVQANKGKISIGRNCAINNFVQIASGDAKITIGNFVRIGPGVTILSSSRNFKSKDQLIMNQGFSDAETTIEDDVLIGSGSTVLKGCTIGKGAVIGAGSVVTKNVPPYCVVAGVPAQVMGKRE